MYYKISNMFDYMMMYSAFKDKSPKITLDAVLDKVKILEESINKVRDFRDYGSSIMLFPTEKAFDNVYDKFLEHYKVDDDLAEYCDELTEEDGVVWKEKLFLIGSETGFVLVYPERR